MSNRARTTGLNGVAFFDVDETLLNLKSMVSFYLFFCQRFSREERTLGIRALNKVLTSTEPREQANASYYHLLAGQSETDVAEAGRAWFQQILRHGAIEERVLTRLVTHRANGYHVVLVSGSFPACLNPVATYVHADRILCSRPEIIHGDYTGLLDVPMIGSEKASAVKAVIAEFPPDTPSWAYGDHASDLPMLNEVRHAVVVGHDPTLREAAKEKGWQTLPQELVHRRTDLSPLPPKRVDAR